MFHVLVLHHCGVLAIEGSNTQVHIPLMKQKLLITDKKTSNHVTTMNSLSCVRECKV